ncbi:MAG: response regulator [Beijerinckiaceae bacterium]|jgi:two-component system, chemotaxis family, chemotaxis protein CheY|nr:response regulator [Beijerinckiaceae bacterium]MDO9442344.1 response regulator [Beijerinckiaceae bacterium]
MFSSLSVLLVEDDTAFLEAAKLMLSRIGFGRIDAVPDAESARERLSLTRYDLILSDWNMEPTSGYDLLVHVRREQRLVPTPFILMTANLSEDYWVAAIRAGASDFLRKPFSFSALRESIRMVLEPAAAADDHVAPVRERRVAAG